MQLAPLPGRYAICRLPAAAGLPSWLPADGFTSCTRTAGELSIVCDERAVPDGVPVELGWRVLAVDGPLAFDQVGVVAGLTAPLAAAGVSVFVVSTYDTDHLLVRAGQYAAARAALQQAGYFTAPVPAELGGLG